MLKSLSLCLSSLSLVLSAPISKEESNKNVFKKAPQYDADSLPNNCRGLADGTYLMKLIDSDEYPIVSMKCSNGYGILDYSYDSDITSYFSSWTQWFPRTAGPINSEHINWQEWFLPTKFSETETITDSDGNSKALGLTKFVLSPDCSSCDSYHERNLYGDQTTYWMTGTIFGCFWKIKGSHNCDVDYDTDSCYACYGIGNTQEFSAISDDTPDTIAYDHTGVCPHNVRQSDYYVAQLHDDCTQYVDGDHMHLKPSIGIESQHCVCFQQPTTSYYTVDSDDLATAKEKQEAKTTEDESGNNNNNNNGFSGSLYSTKTADENADAIEIYQKDFAKGTYRITEPGTYIIMEDIIFDFNAPDGISGENGGNSMTLENFDSEAYWPFESQSDDYPGAGAYKDAYFAGFFAGITIECNDVTLDLNGKTLKMSEYFYYQQRWFTTIELTTQYFLPGQGFGNFGGNPSIATNVNIKNGILGLTSHHGIHGNYNKNIYITDVKVQHFETHGIQLNGFDNVYLTNVEVGPTSDKVKFTGEYAHMRMLLFRYKAIADELDSAVDSGEKTEEDLKISFYGREEEYTTMRDIVDEVELQMQLAWDYAVNGKEYNENDDLYKSFSSAKKLFINENGYVPYGGAQYGIFLNTFGASVFTYNLNSNFYSTKAYLNNVKIHGMRHSMKEYVRLDEAGTVNIMVNPFVAPLNAEELFESVEYDDLQSPKYKGNIFLDAIIASNKFSNSWDYLGAQVTKSDFLDSWAQSDDFTKVTQADTGFAEIACNSDVMIHSGKGINGLRLDGVEQVYIEDIEVYDLYDSTPLGKTVCGDYSAGCDSSGCILGGGHFRQTQPMQVGFSGNMNQGININAAKSVSIKNANVNNIVSETGPAFGISIWPACEVTLEGDININNLIAGKEIEEGTYSYDDRPNRAPEVCGMRVYYLYDDYETTITDDNANYNIDSESMTGHVGCMGSDSLFDYVSRDDFDELVTATADTLVLEGDDYDTANSNNKKINVVNSKLSNASNNNNSNMWIGAGIAFGILLLLACVYRGNLAMSSVKAQMVDGYTLVSEQTSA